MSCSSEPGRHRQRGDALIEALIGIVLMSVIGLGITYASSRATVSQRDMKVQYLAVSQMRNLLALHGNALCSNSALARINLPQQSSPITLTATCTTPAGVTMGGVSTSNATTVVLTTRSSDNALFGGVIRVGDET